MEIMIKTVVILFFLFASSLSSVLASPVWTDPSGDQPAQLVDLEVVFARVLSVVLTLSGIAFFVMILLGGYKYLTAGDNPKNAEAAQKTLTFAVIGFVLVIASWLIIQIVEEFTGLNLSTFQIYTEN